MSTFEQTLKNGSFIGIVEDNKDPDRKQRVRVRVPYLHGDSSHIPNDALPWAQPTRDNNGLKFIIPDINKIVTVKYPTGNLYFPIYEEALHLNINLQNKIEELSDDDYIGFVSLCYNHNTQIYINNTDGLNIYHKYNGFKIEDSQVTAVLKDKSSRFLMGNEDADQELLLGTNWISWFDSLINVLQSPYNGNNGVPVIPTPDMINVLAQYNALKKDFLSKRIFAVDNDNNKKHEFDVVGQLGDNFTQSKVENKKLNIETSELTQVVVTEESSTRTIIEEPIDFKPAAPIVNVPKTSNVEDPTPTETSDIIQENYVDPEYSDDVYEETEEEAAITNVNNDDDYGDWLSDSNEEDSKYVYIAPPIDPGDLGGSGYLNYEANPNIPVADNILKFDLANIKFLEPSKSIQFNETFRLYLPYDKLPEPKLNKKILIGWKLNAEGGRSRATTDTASTNKDNICPTPLIEKGKKIYGFHTNKGITYSVWKNTFGKGNDKRFLHMSHVDWETIFDKKYWNIHATSKYESVNCLLVSFAWGGNKPICVTAAETMLGNKLDNVPEKQAIAALLSARAQFFVNISQPSYKNNANRIGWIRGSINPLLKKIYG